MKKAYFQYYESFDAIINRLRTDEARDKLRRAVIAYGLYGEEPAELNEVEEIAFFCVRELIDQQKHRREVNAENRKPKQEQKPEEPAEEPKPKQERFTKPTEEEVTAYVKEKGYTVSPAAFIAYYDANGWKVGRNPMKNWRAAVVNWQQREGPKGGGTLYQSGDSTAADYSDLF